MPSLVLDGNDLSDFKAVITEFLLRFSGYEDLENVFFFFLILEKAQGRCTQRTVDYGKIYGGT